MTRPERGLPPFLAAVDVSARAAPLPRADVYRRLVRANLSTVIDNAFPVARAVLGERFEAEVFAPFMAAGGPSTSLYRLVPGDLVAWAAAAEHPYADLLHYEWLELVAARHPADVDALGPPDGRVRPNPTLQLGVYSRPVHLISADVPSPAPFATPTAYLVWRRPITDEVAFHRAGLVVARALELAAAAEAHGEPLDVTGLARALSLEAPLPADVIQAALRDAFVDLRARDALRD